MSFRPVRVRMRGLEPPRPKGHTDLNRARLPIPPHPLAWDSVAGGCCEFGTPEAVDADGRAGEPRTAGNAAPTSGAAAATSARVRQRRRRALRLPVAGGRPRGRAGVAAPQDPNR